MLLLFFYSLFLSSVLFSFDYFKMFWKWSLRLHSICINVYESNGTNGPRMTWLMQCWFIFQVLINICYSIFRWKTESGPFLKPIFGLYSEQIRLLPILFMYFSVACYRVIVACLFNSYISISVAFFSLQSSFARHCFERVERNIFLVGFWPKWFNQIYF